MKAEDHMAEDGTTEDGGGWYSNESATFGDRLVAAREALIASGYRPVGAGAKPDFVLSLGLTSDEAGEVLKLDLNVGAEVEGRFDPQQASIVVGLTPEEGCEVELNELVREIVGALPPHDPEGER